MNPIYTAAAEVQDFCARQGWAFCFIGGVAVQRWGEPRLTVDVDLTLLTGFGQESGYTDALLERFGARVPEAREFAMRNRVLLLSASNGVPLDIALGAMPFEERSIQRASDFDVESGMRLRTCSAEDLIVHKAFAGRDRDWADISAIASRQGNRLDIGLIHRELDPLLQLKGAPESRARLDAILRSAAGE